MEQVLLQHWALNVPVVPNLKRHKNSFVNLDCNHYKYFLLQHTTLDHCLPMKMETYISTKYFSRPIKAYRMIHIWWMVWMSVKRKGRDAFVTSRGAGPKTNLPLARLTCILHNTAADTYTRFIFLHIVIIINVYSNKAVHELHHRHDHI